MVLHSSCNHCVTARSAHLFDASGCSNGPLPSHHLLLNPSRAKHLLDRKDIHTQHWVPGTQMHRNMSPLSMNICILLLHGNCWVLAKTTKSSHQTWMLSQERCNSSRFLQYCSPYRRVASGSRWALTSFKEVVSYSIAIPIELPIPIELAIPIELVLSPACGSCGTTRG